MSGYGSGVAEWFSLSFRWWFRLGWQGCPRLRLLCVGLGVPVQEQDAAHFVDGMWIGLTRVGRADHQVRIDAIDMGTRVLHNAIIAFLHWAVAVHSYDRVGGDAGHHRNGREGADEPCARRHVMNRRRDNSMDVNASVSLLRNTK